MYDWQRRQGTPGYPPQQFPPAPGGRGFAGPITTAERSLLSAVVGWIGFSIGLTALGTYLYGRGAVGVHPLLSIIVVFAALFGTQWAATTGRHALAVGLFGLLALTEGVFIGPVVTTYLRLDSGVVVSALLGTVGIFILAAAVVWSTSFNFAAWTKGLIIALLVGIVVSIGALLLGFSTLLVSAFLGVVFVGLTLADFSRVRDRQRLTGGRSDSLLLAISLYLDFLNLFLILLQLLGSRDR